MKESRDLSRPVKRMFESLHKFIGEWCAASIHVLGNGVLPAYRRSM